MTQKSGESKFNRSAFKDTVTSGELKAADKQVANVINRGQRDNYVGFHELESGVNKFAVMPSHEAILQMTGKEVKNEPFVVPKQVYWLPREVDDKDEKGEVKKDKKGQPLKKIINMPVYDARIHAANSKEDIVDVYIQMLKAKFEAEYEGDPKKLNEYLKEKMLPVYGSYVQHIVGIIGKPAWIVYAEKLNGSAKELARLEIGRAVKMRVNELIAIEESNQLIGSESNNPFTDIELRRALTIKYNKSAEDSKLVYITEIDSEIDKDPSSPTYKQVKFYPLSDDELEAFLKLPSLSSMYKNCYTQKDFDFAVSGLQLFDDKHEFGIFGSQDFLDICEDMRKLYPEPKEETTIVEEEAATEEEETGGDKFDEMNRDELKQFARVNKTGVVIHSKMEDAEARDALRKWEATQSVVEEQVEKTDIEKALDSRESAKAETKTGSTGKTATERIAAIRAKSKTA